MKLVAVSVVQNEADIIEAFVRHTAAWMDRHLIFDQQSTDGTREILGELAREGLPIELFGGQATANRQQRNRFLTRIAFSEHQADWVFLLDADEILVAANRAALEQALEAGSPDQPLTLGMHTFVPSRSDDKTERNPVLRLRHRQPHADGSCKVAIPRALGIRPEITVDEGNRTLFEGSRAIEGRRTGGVWLARYPLREPVQQMMRVATAELQRLSRGQAYAGLDTHYRLGFQLLSENPEEFLAIAERPNESLVLDPVPYSGGALRFMRTGSELVRGARAFLPFLETLARSHGRLLDGLKAAPDSDAVARLDPGGIPPINSTDAAAFSGFTPVAGWEAEDGPIASAFLPKFHWTTAPEAALDVHAKTDGTAWLTTELLTYAEAQVTTVVLNGVELHRHVFAQVNQRDTLSLPLRLRAGENRLAFRHRSWLRSAHDPRKLAVIFLSLRVS
jgi:hypothetical protein